MSDVIRIKKGLDIRLEGKADTIYGKVKESSLYALKPSDFPGLTPKPALKVGAKVKVGTVIFFDKYNPEIKFVSPVSGELEAINRGERRKILDFVVKSDKQFTAEDFGTLDPKSAKKEEVIEKMLNAGMWPSLRQRPYGIIANPQDEPKAIFISAFDTAPLAPDYNFIAEGKEKELQAGIDALSQLTKGDIHIGVKNNSDSSVFESLKGVKINTFEGPHPIGNVGVQISKVSPINKGEIVWTIQIQDLISLGNLFLTGNYDASRVVALTGSEINNTAYFKSHIGCSIVPYTKENVAEGKLRYISGNVLTGSNIGENGHLGYYDSQFTVIPEGDEHDFMGWATPNLKKFSVSKSYFSWLCPKKEYSLNANLNGGRRAFIVSEQYEKVMPMDILPEHLIKAILSQDIDKMEQLGIYEVVEEDLALCEFVCTSKLEIQNILRQGIDVMIKEMN